MKLYLNQLIILMALTLFFSCSDPQEPTQTDSAGIQSDTFTFFDVGGATKYSTGIRKELNKKLGNDAIANRSIIDLEINYPGFLNRYFPQLHKLNNRLNSPTGERVEHRVVNLMYRYAKKLNAPFDYTELIFSEYSKTPLIFRINIYKDETEILGALEEKYGQPETINWEKNGGKSFFWRKNMEALIVSLVPDQFGNPQYHIVIYFAENIEKLINTEKDAQTRRDKDGSATGKTAF
jgi:hypothetical protein